MNCFFSGFMTFFNTLLQIYHTLKYVELFLFRSKDVNKNHDYKAFSSFFEQNHNICRHNTNDKSVWNL